jgi:uncharacterized protein
MSDHDNDVKYIKSDRRRKETNPRRKAARDRKSLTGLLNGGTFNCVKITFDPAKRQAVLNQRGLNFADAVVVFAGPTITVEDARQDYGETRFQTVGFLADRIVMLVWPPRNEARHVISMRKCNDREKVIYQKRFSQG